MRCGATVSATGHTGQSEDIHSPEECASNVVRRMRPASASIAVVWTVAISCRLRHLRTISSPLASEAYLNVRGSSRGNGEWIVAVSDFSGLASSPCAFANAVAIAPIVSLELCMSCLRLNEIEADRTRLRAFGPDTVADRLLGVLWHQGFELH